MAREAFTVGDHDPVRGLAEHCAQGMDLRGRAAAARGSVGFVRNEDHARRHFPPRDAGADLRLPHQHLHHPADVADIQPSPVEGAIRGHGRDHVADRPQATLRRRVRTLDDQGRGAHPHDQAMTPPIEGNGRLLDRVVGGGGAAGEEACPEPLDQVVRRNIVRRDDDDAAAASRADPILRHGHRLRRAGAGGVDLRVRAPRADQLGELRVSHRERPEEKTPVEEIRLAGHGPVQFGDAPVEFPRHDRLAIRIFDAIPQAA